MRGGGAYLKNRDQIINAMQVPKSQGSQGVRGHASPKHFCNFRSSICWKCTEIVNPTITTLFCNVFLKKPFIIPSDGPFLLLGGGGGGLEMAFYGHETDPVIENCII